MKVRPITEHNLIETVDSISGICPNCGHPIQQSTYTDYCPCGHSDQSYIN